MARNRLARRQDRDRTQVPGRKKGSVCLESYLLRSLIATCLASQAPAAVIVEWTGQASPGEESVFQLLSSNLNPPVPTLVDGQAFRLDVFVTGPTDNLRVSALLAFRSNQYLDGQPIGGGSGFGPSPVTLLEPGHWTGTFVSRNPPFVVMPGVYRLNYSALVGAQIDRTPGGTPAAFGYRFVITSVPESATWAMMIAGFGMAGAAMRRRTGATVSLA